MPVTDKSIQLTRNIGMNTCTFITGNPKKAEQLSRHLHITVDHKTLAIPEIQSLDLEEVTTAKAEAAFAVLGTPVLVEDTALTFAALHGLPGTFVKWFLEAISNDGLTKLLQGYENRAATAETCFALCDETGVSLFKGVCHGTIASTPRGTAGFGWDAVFIPEGSEQTWAEMGLAASWEGSMRQRAIDELQAFLETYL